MSERERRTILKQLDPIETGTGSVPFQNVQTEGVHTDDVDEAEILKLDIWIIGQGTTGITGRVLTRGRIDVGEVHDAVDGESGETESLGTTSIVTGVPQSELGGSKAESKVGSPIAGDVVGEQPGVARSIGIGRLADDVAWIVEADGGGGGGGAGGDTGGREVDDLLVRRGRTSAVGGTIAEAGEGTAEENLTVGSLDDAEDGTVEASKGKVGPTAPTDPGDGVGGVAGLELAADVDGLGGLVTEQGGHLPGQAWQGGDAGGVRIEHGDAVGLDATQTGEAAADDDAGQGAALHDEGAHGFNVGVGRGEGGKGPVEHGSQDGSTAVGVEGILVLLSILIERDGVKVAHQADSAQVGEIQRRRWNRVEGDGLSEDDGQEEGPSPHHRRPRGRSGHP